MDNRAMGKMLLMVAGLIVGGIIVSAIMAKPEPPLLDRVDRECQMAFGSRGEVAVNDCKLKLMLRYATEAERNRLDSAYQRAK